MRRALGSDTRGAAMIFGVFFAMFMIAAVYSLQGLIEAMMFREHVQDAADAAAFSAAVVNARGMNLIVLLNLLMAALLAILVGIRLGQTVCLIAIGVCIALSYPTMGQSMHYVPKLTSITKRLQEAFDRAKPLIHQALGVIHVAGKATSVAIPIGANLRVIDLIASRYNAVGLAIPTRFTLPVEDDDFPVLCGHAGEIAGYVAMLPLSPILPDKIENALASGLEKLAAAGSSWFCGEGSSPPDISPDGEDFTDGVQRFPRFPSQDACEAAPGGEEGTPEDAEKTRLCDLAAFESLLSIPGRNGELRVGERLCPTDCKDNPRESCPPGGFQDCDAEQAADMDRVAIEHLGTDRIVHKIDNAFVRGFSLAREQCKPSASRTDLRAFEWLEQAVTRTYRFNPTTRKWEEDRSAVRINPTMKYIKRDRKDAAYPCGGPEAVIAPGYEEQNEAFVCEGRPVCEEVGVFPGSTGECPRPPSPTRQNTFRETTTQVIKIVACAAPLPVEKHQVQPIDLNKEVNGDNSSNTSSFRLEKDLYLGGSDFQLRAAVYSREGAPGGSERYVGVASWGRQAENRTPEAVVRAAQATGRLGLAQAEYYFDWSGLEDKPSNQRSAGDVSDWMWNMCWRARLRPFRLNHADADGPRGSNERGFDAEQLEFGGDGLSDLPTDAPACAGQAECGDVQSAMGMVTDWGKP